MFGKRIALGSLSGFQVYIDMSWLFLAFLIVWTLSAGYFPATYPGLAGVTYLVLGVLGAAGLFLSIILHELSHAIVARHYGLPMGGITLFIFGGIAEMTDEPPSPKVEALMALAGPAASYVIGGLFFLLYLIFNAAGPPALMGLVWYLGLINIILATFNLVPGFPLDGGRVLRAGLWAWKKDLVTATRIASQVGSAVAGLLMFLGLLSLLGGNLIGGFWWGILGFFLWSISKANYQAVLVRELLKGQAVRYFMKTGPVAVPPDLTISDLVTGQIYLDPRPLYPVASGGRLLGCITIEKVRTLPAEEWHDYQVGELAEECGPDYVINPETDVTEALKTMRKSQVDQLLVADESHFFGTISQEDIMKYARIRLELEPRRFAG